MKRYKPEVVEFITQNVVGCSAKELARLTNEQFGTEFTENTMKSFKTNHKLKSGRHTHAHDFFKEGSRVFPIEVVNFIVEHHNGCGPKEMAQRLNETFGTAYTTEQINAMYKNHGINSGLTGRFELGSIPPNKGKTGYHSPGCEKGWFKQGHKPSNLMPVGTELAKDDGYLWRKVAEPNQWRHVHLLIWEEVHGPVNEDCVITFLDGDKANTNIANLAEITRAEHIELTRRKTRSANPQITQTAILAARVSCTRRKIIKNKKENCKNVSD